MYSQHNGHPHHPPVAPQMNYGQQVNNPPNMYGYAPPHAQQYMPPMPTPPSMYAGPSTVPQQQYNPYPYNPRPIPQSPSVQSIPEPPRRAEYQAPVFKTFQERKREREAALRAATEAASPKDSPTGSPVTTHAPSPPIARSPLVPPSSARPVPPSSALAMMGIPGQPAPTPPPRVARTPSVAQPQPQIATQPWTGVPTPPVRATSPIPQAPSPAPPTITTAAPSAPPRVPSIVVPPSQVPPRSASPTPPIQPARPLPKASPSMSGPQPAAVSAVVERSDTISSVKSLDRVGFGPGRRALPRPPGGVAPSKSLDRGNLPPTDVRRMQRRGPPSPVSEEDTASLAARLAGVSVGGIVPGSSTSPPTTASSPRSPVTPIDSPAVNGLSSRGMSPMPTICIDEAPKSPAIPTISIGHESQPKTPAIPTIAIACEPEAPKAPTIPTIAIGGIVEPPAISVSPPRVSVNPPSQPASPGFEISGLPTIEVSSSDTRIEQANPITIAVPNIHVRPASPSPSAGPTRIHANSAILCAGCTNPIIGRIVSAMNQRWHPQCFMCGVCNELLEHVSAYEHEGKPYCHLDYHDRFAHKCHHCQTPIVDPSFVTLEDENLGQRYYHELHFFCSECGDPFLDPSKSSAPGGLAQGEETNPFVIHKGHPYCERCHLRLHKPKCRKCRLPIPDVAVSAMGAKWHAECFVCDNCDGPFANNLFFPREGRAYCTECFEGMN